MADEERTALEPEDVQVTDAEGHSYVAENRRYVGRKETVGYVVWDMAQSFNINAYNSRFVTNILQIDMGFQELFTVINGIWDVVNDVFTGAIVDKTRTRWGKFKPYLVLLAGPGTILTCLYWLLPLFFPNAPALSIPKFVAYMALGLIREGVGTFQAIAQNGLIATITPHPVDRTRLITVAQFFSGFLGEKLPEQIMTVLIDLIGNSIIKPGPGKTVKDLYMNLYVGFGLVTSIVSGIASLWFNLITKERVMQSIERPSIWQGVKSIINNKPILLKTLSEILGSFTLGGSRGDYFIDVLNFSSLGMITGIPGAIIHPFGYAIVPWAKRKFSTKWLYIISNNVGDFGYFLVFLFGSIGGKKNGMYKKIVPMGIALTIWEMFFMAFYGIKKVIPTEMENEAMDYCEWKNGYRTEAMTGVAKGLAKKLAGIFTSAITLRLKRMIGYDQTLYVKGEKQTDSVQYYIFAIFSGVPMITSIICIIPMLFYDLQGEKRDRMYAELLASRAHIAEVATSGDKDAMAQAAKEQMAVGEKHNK